MTEPIAAIRPTTTARPPADRAAATPTTAARLDDQAAILAPTRTNADVDTAYVPGGCEARWALTREVVARRTAAEAAADAQVLAQVAALYEAARPRADAPPVTLPVDRRRPHPFERR